MKCSLLTLSSYLDHELEASRAGEVEAHLVGCARCRGGLDHLTEESRRIAELAPAHVPDHSVHALLEQLKLIGPDDPLPERVDVELDGWGSPGGPDAQPWRRDGPAPALPLTARRDDYLRRRSLAARESDGSGPGGGEESRHEPSADPSGAGGRSPWDRSSAAPSAVLVPDRLSEAPELPFPPQVAALAATAPPAPPGDPSVSSTWTSPPDADPWSARPPEAPATAEPHEPDLGVHDWDVLDDEESPRAAPLRAARPSLLGRVRERVAMYRALSRGPVDDFDDSVQVVSGTGAPLRGTQSLGAGRRGRAVLPGSGRAAPPAPLSPATDLTGTSQPRPARGRRGPGGTGLGPPVHATHGTPPAPPLPGIAFPTSPPSWASRPRPWVDSSAPIVEAGPLPAFPVPAAPAPAPPADPVPAEGASPAMRGRIPGWGDATTTAPPSSASEPAWTPTVDYPTSQRTVAAEEEFEQELGPPRGRHGRTAQGRTGQSRSAMPAAVAGIGRHAARLRGEAPRRLVAALAAVAVLTVVGLVTGRSTSPNRAGAQVTAGQSQPAAQRPQPSGLPGAAVPPNPSAAAVSLRPSAAPAAAPPAPASSAAASGAPLATTAGLTDPHLLGDGAAGYGLRGIRYGAHPGGYRVVFDLGSADASAGTPRVVVGNHDPRTVWVELFGVSSGPVRQPDPSVVSGVALLPRDTVAGATVYALSLVHPSTVSAGYVGGPVRLVLDLH